MLRTTTAEAAPPPEPSSTGARVELFDILRGFAILGILLVNFRGPVTESLQVLDEIVVSGLNHLVLGSFYPLFSFLFGLGFAIQLRRAEHRGQRVTLLWVRRMAALLLIGTAHAVLIWSGDILVDYALVGLLLIPLVRLPSRWILALIVVLFALQLHPNPVRQALDQRRTLTVSEARDIALAGGARAEDARVRSDLRARAGRTFRSDVEIRWERYANKISRFKDAGYLLTRDLLLLFLAGFYVGRRRWLEAGRSALPWFALAAGVGAVAAVVANLPWEVEGGTRRFLRMLSSYGVTVFYVSTITAAVALGGVGLRALRVFASVGRTALSNYLLQSLVMTWLFLPYGMARGYPPASLFVVLHLTFFFMVQVPISQWWLDRFRFGPAEWVWRCMVHGRLLQIWNPTALVGGEEGAKPLVAKLETPTPN